MLTVRVQLPAFCPCERSLFWNILRRCHHEAGGPLQSRLIGLIRCSLDGEIQKFNKKLGGRRSSTNSTNQTSLGLLVGGAFQTREDKERKATTKSKLLYLLPLSLCAALLVSRCTPVCCLASEEKRRLTNLWRTRQNRSRLWIRPPFEIIGTS